MIGCYKTADCAWSQRGGPCSWQCRSAAWCGQHVYIEFVYASSGVAFALMLVRFLAADARRTGVRDHDVSPAQKSIVAMLGLSSYPTYLFHGPILMVTGWAILRWNLNLDWRLIWALSASIAIVIGVALGLWAERPIMAWRASLLKRHFVPHRASIRRTVEGAIG